MTAVIATHQLTVRFGRKTAVDRLDLSVPEGAIFALLGDNGAGKSTTIRVLTGQLRPDAGRAEVLGLDSWWHAVPLRHRVGYVPERPRYYDWMTVEEIGWFVGGFHKPPFRPRYAELAAKLGLERKARLRDLSKGGYAKVGLALALAVDPEVLLLDEPTSGLDLFTRREFLGGMVELAGQGRTILISSHGVAEVERVASHVGFLENGKLLLAGRLDEVRQRFVRVRLRAEMPVDPAGLGRVLERQALGRQQEVVLLDPVRGALESLRGQDGVADVEEAPLTLEEMYSALLGGPHVGSEAHNGAPVGQAAAMPAARENGP
jgi:ABC-2 type transport system ATP-binding protein